MSFDNLKSNIISLRAPEEGDVDRLFFWENDRSLLESLATAAPVSRYQVWEYIRNYNADPFASGELRLMICDSAADNVVGYVDLFGFDAVNRRSGIGIYIDEDFRKRGYASEALRLIGQYAHETLGIHQLWAIIAVDNNTSIDLFTAAGFKPSGKLRSWIRRGMSYSDALVFQHLYT